MEGFVLRTGTKFLLSFALFGAILGVGTRTSAAESVKISYSAISWLMTPVWIAEELGLFKKNGLDAQLIYAILRECKLRLMTRRLSTSSRCPGLIRGSFRNRVSPA